MQARADEAINRRRERLVQITRLVLFNPELGLAETETPSLVSEKLDELGVVYETGIALTGVKGFFEGAVDGPTVVVIGEMDALPVLGPLMLMQTRPWPTHVDIIARSLSCWELR